MSNILQTLKLSWAEVGALVGSIISAVLKREITCRAALDDYNYWTVSDTAGRFSHDDLDILLDYVEASREIREITFHGDSDTAVALDMGLSQAMLKKKLNTSWEQELITEDGLWLVGIDPEHLNYAGTITVDGKIISMDTLWSKEELVEQLFDAGGSEADLSDVCDRYVKQYGNQLYWSYPIPDGEYNGVYFVLVQEGVLCLPYDEIDRYEYEIFERDGVRLLTAEEMGYFISDWKRESNALEKVMSIFKNYLKARERNEPET